MHICCRPQRRHYSFKTNCLDYCTITYKTGVTILLHLIFLLTHQSADLFRPELATVHNVEARPENKPVCKPDVDRHTCTYTHTHTHIS